MTQLKTLLTETDKRAIEELRSRLSKELKEVPSYSDDYSLLRWLIGWDYKIDLIVPKLKRTLSVLTALKLHEADFSSIDRVTEYVSETCSVMNYYPGGILGYDKEGNVVILQPMAKVDPKSLLPSGRMSDIFINRIAESEGVVSLIRANEKRLNRKLGAILIADMEGFNLDLVWMPGMKTYTTLLQLLQELFPDAILKVYIIRAPAAIQIAFNMIYPVLAKQTREKFEFLGSDWKEKLQQVIPPEELFEHWGGTRPASTPFGHIRMGGKVPKGLRYNPDDNPEEPTPKQLTSLSVSARSSETVTVKVERADSRLKWFYRMSSGDIDFSINHNSGKMILPAFRLSTELVPEWGEVICELPGEYTLKFDNTHGKIWSKEIKYRVQVVAPNKG